MHPKRPLIDTAQRAGGFLILIQKVLAERIDRVTQLDEQRHAFSGIGGQDNAILLDSILRILRYLCAKDLN